MIITIMIGTWYAIYKIKRHREGLKMIIAEEKFNHKLLVKKGIVFGQIFTHIKTGRTFSNPFDAEKFAAKLFKKN
jgi:hypothetical protein